jgi:hypothetical protein
MESNPQHHRQPRTHGECPRFHSDTGKLKPDVLQKTVIHIYRNLFQGEKDNSRLSALPERV